MAPGRRRRDAPSDDEEGEEQPQNRSRNSVRGRAQPESEDESDDADADGRSQGRSSGVESQLAYKFVRYALACEYSRSPIRREAVREKVYAGEPMRNFRAVFELAQKHLRTIFGMQLVEQPSKDRSLMSLEQKRKAAKAQRSTGPTGKSSTNAWILTTILPPELRTPQIISPSKVLSSEGEAAYAGFYTLIISIITLSGGEISDAVFHRLLTRLNANKTVPSMNPNNKNQPSEPTDIVLQRLIKQGYLLKASSGDDGDESVTWHVGPRGKVEVDNEAIAGMVRTVYGVDGGEDLESKLVAALGVRPRVSEQREGIAEGEDTEQEEQRPGTPGGKRRRVNTAGEASPMPIRTRGDGDPGPSSRRGARQRA